MKKKTNIQVDVQTCLCEPILLPPLKAGLAHLLRIIHGHFCASDLRECQARNLSQEQVM